MCDAVGQSAGARIRRGSVRWSAARGESVRRELLRRKSLRREAGSPRNRKPEVPRNRKPEKPEAQRERGQGATGPPGRRAAPELPLTFGFTCPTLTRGHTYPESSLQSCAWGPLSPDETPDDETSGAKIDHHAEPRGPALDPDRIETATQVGTERPGKPSQSTNPANGVRSGNAAEHEKSQEKSRTEKSGAALARGACEI